MKIPCIAPLLRIAETHQVIVVVNARERFPFTCLQLLIKGLKQFFCTAGLLGQTIVNADADFTHHVAGQLHDLPSSFQLFGGKLRASAVATIIGFHQCLGHARDGGVANAEQVLEHVLA